MIALKKINNRIKHYTLPLLTLAWFITISIFMYFMFFPFKVVSLDKFEVVTPTISKGESVCYNLDFEKYMDIKPTISYYLIDGIVYQLDEGGTNRSVGENKVHTCWHIPETFFGAPGEYRIKIDLSYEVFKLRSPINYSWTSNSFIIK